MLLAAAPTCRQSGSLRTPTFGGSPVQTESGCSQQAGTLDVSVQNAGPEIDAKDLPKLFDRFYRVDSARRHSDGSEGPGLGLAIVKAIVKAHGGSVRATSALGLTCIFIQLPLPQRRSAKG
jgi:signal transduction histidine kinase